MFGRLRVMVCNIILKLFMVIEFLINYIDNALQLIIVQLSTLSFFCRIYKLSFVLYSSNSSEGIKYK